MISVRHKAMDYLARREHACQELAKKLRDKGYGQQEIQQALAKLQQEGLLSDQRFMVSYCRYRYSRGFGPVAIRSELLSRGINELDCQNHIAGCDLDWQASLMRVWKKKFKQRPDSAKVWAKQYRFLRQRGFESDAIRAWLR
jgi:regulatory protein